MRLFRTMPFARAALALALFTSGCAALGDRRIDEIDPNLLPGRAYVARHCSGCHAVNPKGSSPNAGAPPFRMMKDLTPGDIRHAAVDQSGYPQLNMPAIVLTPREARQITAYIKALDNPDPRLRRRLYIPPCLATTPC